MENQQIERAQVDIQRRIKNLEQKKKELGPVVNRIGFGIDLVMKLTALLFDILGMLLELIPFAGGIMASLLSIGGDVGLGLSYFLIGIKPIGKGVKGNKTLIVRIAAMLTELVPYVNIVPAFSVAVWYTNGVIRKEDKLYNERMKTMRQMVEEEERKIMQDIQALDMTVQEYEETEYNNEQYEANEAAEQNQVYDDEDEEDRMAA